MGFRRAAGRAWRWRALPPLRLPGACPAIGALCASVCRDSERGRRVLKDEQQDTDNDPNTVELDDRTEHYDEYFGRPRRMRLAASYTLLLMLCSVPAAVDYGLVFDLSHRK